VSEEERAMFDEAARHNDRYLLHRVYGRRQEDSDPYWITAGKLVDSRHARWISWVSPMAPGIELTGKPADVP
jgi:hypothetical protein